MKHVPEQRHGDLMPLGHLGYPPGHAISDLDLPKAELLFRCSCGSLKR